MDILILSAGADEVIMASRSSSSSSSSPPVLGLGEVVLTPSLSTLGEALGTGAGDGEKVTPSLSTLGEALGTGDGDVEELTPSLSTLGEALGTGAGDGEEVTPSLSTLGEALGTGDGNGVEVEQCVSPPVASSPAVFEKPDAHRLQPLFFTCSSASHRSGTHSSSDITLPFSQAHTPFDKEKFSLHDAQ